MLLPRKSAPRTVQAMQRIITIIKMKMIIVLSFFSIEDCLGAISLKNKNKILALK